MITKTGRSNPGQMRVGKVKLTRTEASRFLHQATMGPSRGDIERLVAKGYDRWLEEQFSAKREISHVDWLVSNGLDNSKWCDNTLWRGLISSTDQLRHRVAHGLLDFLVIGLDGLDETNRRGATIARYMDILLDNAFLTYRDILGGITFSSAMAQFLTYINGSKADPTIGSQPDENYAREIMQLFTIGLYELNNDGSLKRDANGDPIETYDNDDVAGLARIFSGFRYTNNDINSLDRVILPLVIDEAAHEQEPSTFLGKTISGPGIPAVNAALDWIFNHSNLPPFVCRHLIQRLTSSNPSPAYMTRVVNVFINNGRGVRGDMKSVIRAILMDTEVRNVSALTSTTKGRLRDPITRFTGWARASNTSTYPAGSQWAVPEFSNGGSLAQSPGRSPSVFGWYRSSYSPPNTEIMQQNLLAPEFQLVNDETVISWINFIRNTISTADTRLSPNYTGLAPLAKDPSLLVNELNLLYAAGQLTPEQIATMTSYIGELSVNSPITRVHGALIILFSSPDYLVLR